ncbi:S-layer homology domain-containing protein, partial [Wukongibacter baidiensis]
MKKIVSFVLVMTFVITTSFSVSFADPWKHGSGKKLPPGLKKKGHLPPGIAKKFNDIDDYVWAEDAIEKMVEKGVIKGIGEGLFAPKREVTKLEAIVMALRVMGEEDEAREYQVKIKQGKRKLEIKDRLQEWAYGYVALAEEKGILDEADILYFKLNEPAKRHEVAKYIVRALGYEDEAQDHMDEDLDYKDASFIPQGSVGYIYIANKEKIIQGYEDETFRPLNTVTRAEMAVMVDRVDDEIDEDELKEYEGEVEDIDNDYDWIKIDIGSRDKKFDITSKTEVVFEDDIEGDIEDIEVGDEVQ